jgi:hypothetical protein
MSIQQYTEKVSYNCRLAVIIKYIACAHPRAAEAPLNTAVISNGSNTLLYAAQNKGGEIKTTIQISRTDTGEHP